MTQTPAARHLSEQQAGSLTTGSHILLPDGERTAEIHQVELEPDDFGSPALVLASLAGGGTLRIAVGTMVSVVNGQSSAEEQSDAVTQLPVAAAPTAVAPAAPGPKQPGDEASSAAPAAPAVAHPDAAGVLLLTDRLAKGVNFKSGSCLKDLSDLAHELFIALKDSDTSLAVADLINVLPFDGNPGRWASVEASLALSSYICRQDGQTARAEVYEKLLRTPENQETDPFKARMAAKVRQRSLNEPNLYDKEIFRSIDNSNHDAEREWRLLRLESLMFLRAHGGSETLGMGELERRISNDLEAVRS